MDSDMDVSVSTTDTRVPVTVFHIKGDIQANTYEELQMMVEQAYQNGMRNLLLDLSDVSYISSAGLRALHYIFTMLRGNLPGESDEAIKRGLMDGSFKSPHLKLLKPSPTVQRILKTAGFDMYLESYDDLREALDSF